MIAGWIRAMRPSLALTVLLAGLAVGGAVDAATGGVLYVDRANPACSDGGSGSLLQPFCSIGAGAARVGAGQSVEVASGIYLERVTVSVSGTSAAPIVFTAAPGANVTVSGQANGFLISGMRSVTVSGFIVTQTSDHGISVSNSSDITLSNNHVSYSGQPVSGLTKNGIRINNTTDSLVFGNIVDHNSDAGVAVVGGSTRNEVARNQTFLNARGYQRAAAGIRLYQAPGNIVHGNVTHDNEDSGIESYPGSNQTLVYNNVSYNNGDHGIDNFGATGQRIIANTVYKNVTAGINVEGTSTGATLENNVSVDNGVKSPRTHGNIRIDASSTSGTTMDHDLVYLSTPDTMLIWKSVSYSSLSAFRAASGQEVHGAQANARWRSATTGDFHLLAGSPAIDSANSGASGQPARDVNENPRRDDPATPDTGVGPRSYDDRGAYEFDGGVLDHLVLSPASATIGAGGSQTYTAQGPPKLLGAQAKLRVTFTKGRTRIVSLRVSRLVTGSRVEVRCLRGCPVRKTALITTGSWREFASLFRRRLLPNRAALFVRVTKPDAIGRYFRWTVSGRRVLKVQCQVPLTGKVERCVKS